jgi:hypothetical protein
MKRILYKLLPICRIYNDRCMPLPADLNLTALYRPIVPDACGIGCMRCPISLRACRMGDLKSKWHDARVSRSSCEAPEPS